MLVNILLVATKHITKRNLWKKEFIIGLKLKVIQSIIVERHSTKNRKYLATSLFL